MGAQGLRAVTPRWFSVWKRNAYVYAKRWKLYALPPLAEPFLLVFALGIGVGSFIDQIEGVTYLVFVSAGLIASETLLRATFECTYGSFFRMTYQNTFEGIITTPVSASDVAMAEIFWGATKASISALAVLLVLAVLGVFSGPLLVLVPLIIFAGALNFSSMALIVSSRVPDLEYFTFYFAGVVFPMLFLAGTYFPLSRLPEIVQSAMWLLPFTSVVDVARSLIIERPDSMIYWKSLYILVSTVVLMELAIRSLTNRLVR